MRLDAFTYLSVLLSIIIGLGMTHVLTAIGRLIRGRASSVAYWPPLLWAGVVLVIYVQVWWTKFGLRTETEWNFLLFVVVLLQTTTLYMMAALVLPEQAEDETMDLQVHYERHSSWFFGFFAAMVLISGAKEVVVEGRLPEPLYLALHVALLVICVTAICVRGARAHERLAVAGAAVLGTYVAGLYLGVH
jgi:hypothetical protein